ncbi:hypothetical protein RI367_001904 [Sorochytrium milnesiophthora]
MRPGAAILAAFAVLAHVTDSGQRLAAYNHTHYLHATIVQAAVTVCSAIALIVIRRQQNKTRSLLPSQDYHADVRLPPARFNAAGGLRARKNSVSGDYFGDAGDAAHDDGSNDDEHSDDEKGFEDAYHRRQSHSVLGSTGLREYVRPTWEAVAFAAAQMASYALRSRWLLGWHNPWVVCVLVGYRRWRRRGETDLSAMWAVLMALCGHLVLSANQLAVSSNTLRQAWAVDAMLRTVAVAMMERLLAQHKSRSNAEAVCRIMLPVGLMTTAMSLVAVLNSNAWTGDSVLMFFLNLYYGLADLATQMAFPMLLAHLQPTRLLTYMVFFACVMTPLANPGLPTTLGSVSRAFLVIASTLLYLLAPQRALPKREQYDRAGPQSPWRHLRPVAARLVLLTAAAVMYKTVLLTLRAANVSTADTGARVSSFGYHARPHRCASYATHYEPIFAAMRPYKQSQRIITAADVDGLVKQCVQQQSMCMRLKIIGGDLFVDMRVLAAAGKVDEAFMSTLWRLYELTRVTPYARPLPNMDAVVFLDSPARKASLPPGPFWAYYHTPSAAQDSPFLIPYVGAWADLDTQTGTRTAWETISQELAARGERLPVTLKREAFVARDLPVNPALFPRPNAGSLADVRKPCVDEAKGLTNLFPPASQLCNHGFAYVSPQCAKVPSLLPSLFLCHVLVLQEEATPTFHFSHLLRPYKHYLPARSTLNKDRSDPAKFSEKWLEYLRSLGYAPSATPPTQKQPEKQHYHGQPVDALELAWNRTMAMASAAHETARSVFSENALRCYTQTLVTEYGSVMDGDTVAQTETDVAFEEVLLRMWSVWWKKRQ